LALTKFSYKRGTCEGTFPLQPQSANVRRDGLAGRKQKGEIKMKNKLLVGLAKGGWVFTLLMILAIYLPGIGYAATYDLKNDWSNLLNPNGVWTYRQGDVVLPLQDDYYADGSNQKAWALAQYPGMNHVPVWLKFQNDSYDFLAGDIAVHPTSHTGSTSQDPANVIWTSPIDGTIAISGNIWWGGWEVDRSTHWELYLNDDLLNSGTVGGYDIYDRSNPMLINDSGILNVNSGDIVTLELTEINPNTWSWFTGVNLTIDAQPVPVPATIFLFGTGIAGLAGIRARRKKK